jgi:hypothetical protein
MLAKIFKPGVYKKKDNTQFSVSVCVSLSFLFPSLRPPSPKANEGSGVYL